MKNQSFKNKFLLTLLALGSLFVGFACSSSSIKSSIANAESLNVSKIKIDSLNKQEEATLKTQQITSIIAQSENNSKAEADRLREEGERLLEAGQYVKGTETLERAMRMYQEIGEKEKYQEVLNRVILIYYTRGAFDKIERLMPEVAKLNAEEDAAESDSQVTPENSNESEIKTGLELEPQVNNLINSGSDLMLKEDYSGARNNFNQALSQAKAIEGEPEEFAALTALGKSYLYEKDYPNALKNFEQAESLSATRYQATEQQSASGDLEKMGNNFREMIFRRIPVLLLLGETYLQQNNPTKALTYLEEASAISTKIDKEYQKFLLPYGINYFEDPSLYLSRANYSLGNYEQALTYTRQAIEKGESIQNPNKNPVYGVRTGDLGNGHGYVLAGIALEKLGQLEQAEQELRKAVQTFESTRKKSTFQGDINDSLKLFDNQVRAASLLQRVLLAQNKPEEALAAAEWGRGRLLVEASTASRELTLEEKVDAIIDAKYASVDICQQTESYFPEANIPEGYEDLFPSTQVQKACDSETLMQAEKESLLQAARKDPKILDLYTGTTPTNTAPSNIEPPNVEQLKQIAQSHQATLVQYSIISETTFFHSSRQDSASRNIFPGEQKTLLISVIKPTGEIQSRPIDLKERNIVIEDLVTSNRQTMGLGRNLGVSLKPGAEVPTGNARTSLGEDAKEQLKQLHRLLIDPIADLLPSNPEANVAFVPDKELFLVPFAALIDSENKYLIEKHTITTAPSIQALDVTQQKQQQINKSQKALVVGNPTMPTTVELPNLPGAEAEGQQVAQLLNAQFLTGNQATETEVVKQLSNAQYVHLATHGLLDDYAGFGLPGAVALAPTNSDDGLLTASEIQELNLTAELVVLSACDTGRGDITGDGVVGLSRALIVAGVPSVVVSLWSVPDAPTSDLMVEFYRNFTEGKLDKAQALRQAMLTVMKTYPNPVDWAAFTLIGEAN
jgi:CHAT domain-containing protein/tetratricopeptide (TPR) repeat protein